MLGKLNGSGLVQASETRKQSGPLTFLLACLDTALTTYLLVSTLIVTTNVNCNTDKTGSGSWDSWWNLPGGGLANHTQGLTKSCDWKINNIVEMGFLSPW